MSTPEDAATPQTEPDAGPGGAPDGATLEGTLVPPEHVPAVSAEALVDGEHAAEVVGEGVEEERRYPSTIGGAFYLLVLGVVTAGLVFVAVGQWRTGIRTFGGALVFAALVRLALKPRDAGMLAVRNKPFDAGVLALLGALMVFLAGSIPDQP
ncbi:MAG: DUF3017 domain-containing protein [Nocardioides sp.]|uniref:DUF3017 domain-containing protein n=1 Tax=Nocardioides sp. TaxID=35761 RepID=UPI003F0BBFC6